MRLRPPEWMLLCYFGYVAAISPWFSDRPHLGFKPAIILLAVVVLLLAIVRSETTRLHDAIAIIRDWLPLALTLAAFREMQLFIPQHFNDRYETIWIRWDHVLLDRWGVHRGIESFGAVIPDCLELCYLLVYAIGPFCIAVLYVEKRRTAIDRFLSIYLLGTLLAYALFPYFPSQPPRAIFPSVDPPSYTSWIRAFNLWILRTASIQSSVFPSAHVSSAFAATWGMFLVLRDRKPVGWGLLAYAISVSVATIYGRYHYAADVLAGFGLSLIPAGLALVMRARQLKAKEQVETSYSRS